MSGTGTARLGKDCKMYRNTGTYGTPVWSEILPVRDNTLPQADDEVDMSSRGGAGSKEIEPSLRDNSSEFEMVYDPADTNHAALQAAYIARTAIELLILDGNVATTGNQGLRATMKLSKFERKEELAGGVLVSVKVNPCKNANAAPLWFTAP
jgi:hypothetical protein